MLIGIFYYFIYFFVNHTLLFCLLINIYITDLEVYPVPYGFL